MERLHHPLLWQVGLTPLLLHTITIALLPLLLLHATTTPTTNPTFTTGRTAIPTTTQVLTRTITHNTTQPPLPNSSSQVERPQHPLHGPHLHLGMATLPVRKQQLQSPPMPLLLRHHLLPTTLWALPQLRCKLRMLSSPQHSINNHHSQTNWCPTNLAILHSSGARSWMEAGR